MQIFDKGLLEKINSNVDLLEYASQFIDFKQNGDYFFAHCPAHVDKTPSLSITPENNMYYCFSCGNHGGIINYLIDYEGLPFREAVEKAIKLSGINASNLCKSDTIAFLRNSKRIALPEKYKHRILNNSEMSKYTKCNITEWIDEGINQGVMDKFGVRIDIKANRIVYPVFDIDGNLINVKGRTRFKNFKNIKVPKYINYYKVGDLDYFQGLNITLDEVRKCGEIIIFESVKSVMKAYGWGYKNCASAEKHGLTFRQILLLLKMKIDIVLAYDSDVNYMSKEIKKNIDKMKKITNVYIIDDPMKLLGGVTTKNAPVDLGKEVWEKLYKQKRKIT